MKFLGLGFKNSDKDPFPLPSDPWQLTQPYSVYICFPFPWISFSGRVLLLLYKANPEVRDVRIINNKNIPKRLVHNDAKLENLLFDRNTGRSLCVIDLDTVMSGLSLYDFGEIGDIGSTKQFTLYNYRETPIIIDSVQFSTASFSTNTSFPMVIEPLQMGIINIDANNSEFNFIEDAMEIISDDLPEGLSVLLSLEGTEGNILSGNLVDVYPAATYRISGDLTISDGDIAYLQAGTELLFDVGINFNIYGSN